LLAPLPLLLDRRLGAAQDQRDQCDCHQTHWTIDQKAPVPGDIVDSQPPNVGPTTKATTTATPNTAKSWPRFVGGNASTRIDVDRRMRDDYP
jgi:hypothetical protein